MTDDTLLTQLPSQTEKMFTAELGGTKFTFKIPVADLGTLYTLAVAANQMEPTYLAAATVGICASNQRTPTMRQGPHSMKLPAFGHSVLNELLAKGIPFLDIFTVGMELFTQCVESLPNTQRVEEHLVPLESPAASVSLL